MTDDQFTVVFPMYGQDAVLIDEIDEKDLNRIGFADVFARPVSRKSVRGIDAPLFFDLQEKKEFYPNRRDSDLYFDGRAFSTADTMDTSA